MIYFESERIELPVLNIQKLNKWIRLVVKTEGKETGSIRYVFCNDARILEINQQFLEHDYFTDIITFDYSENELVGGEIFISLDTIQSNSMQFNSSFEEELHRVIIHGVLHLCGQGDKDESSRKIMTQKEDRALNLLTNLA